MSTPGQPTGIQVLTDETTALLPSDSLTATLNAIQKEQREMQRERIRHSRVSVVYAAAVFSSVLAILLFIAGNEKFQYQMEDFFGEYYPWILVSLGGGGFLSWLSKEFSRQDDNMNAMETGMKEMKTELKTDMKEMKTELKADMHAIKLKLDIMWNHS